MSEVNKDTKGNNLLLNIISKYILQRIVGNLAEEKLLSFAKYNKIIQKK